MPVNNLLVRSRQAAQPVIAYSFPGALELPRSRLSLTGWPRFPRHFHDREDFYTHSGIRPFAIMKHLAGRCAWMSHPPPRAHSPRIPGAFTASHVIVCTYPPYSGG